MREEEEDQRQLVYLVADEQVGWNRVWHGMEKERVNDADGKKLGNRKMRNEKKGGIIIKKGRETRRDR